MGVHICAGCGEWWLLPPGKRAVPSLCLWSRGKEWLCQDTAVLSLSTHVSCSCCFLTDSFAGATQDGRLHMWGCVTLADGSQVSVCYVSGLCVLTHLCITANKIHTCCLFSFVFDHPVSWCVIRCCELHFLMMFYVQECLWFVICGACSPVKDVLALCHEWL